MTAAGIFAEWQPRYAKHGVVTFPVEITSDERKKPLNINYTKTGMRGSGQLALKFADARCLGFMAGRRNRLFIADLDDTDEKIIGEGERLFGPSPLMWRTGGGKFAAAYRYNGEPRLIRPIRGLPIDILGGGFVVAPPSMGARRPYEIIRGSLDDLDRLPNARIPSEVASPARRPGDGERILDGERHLAVFRHAHEIVRHCDDHAQLTDAVRTWAEERLEKGKQPVSDAYIRRTCYGVWEYREGRQRVGNRVLKPEIFEALAANPEFLGIFAFLDAKNGPNSEFMIADGLGEKMGWRRRLVPAARTRMLELGVVERTRRQGRTGPFLYRWRMPLP